MWFSELPKLLAQYERTQNDLLSNRPGIESRREALQSELKRLEIRIKVADSQRAIWAFYIAAAGFLINGVVRVVELALR